MDAPGAGGRYLRIPDAATRSDLHAFLTRAARLDAAALVRLVRRGEAVAVWTTTAGFDTLAGRTFRVEIGPGDISVGAEPLAAEIRSAGGGNGPSGADEVAGGAVTVDPGLPMDTAWRGSLPPADGFEHVDDVPARDLVALSVQGAQVARENSTMTGPPRSLLDQTVLEVDGGGHRVAVPLRSVFALTAMGFVPQAVQDPATGAVDVDRVPADEPVRVRATRTWVRLDARYGSVALRVGGEIPLMVT
ncbi:hypothetical protein FO059_13070 [Tomitella fengzijianii]|uniref:Uncharacterized protein n=1 Tax=Tomitella fengzijianii TaxID=2597660 RepID=A0A516X8F3_9ACTN|nr:hypothetical protein FO059_13070 [Tomitella fengzijianii]